jgi:aldehyde dehydrogenase (NAD+)
MDLGTNWVAGRWAPATRDAAVIVSPIDGEPLHDVRFAGDSEVEAAATEAAAAMAATSQAQRARALSDLAAALKRRAEPIAEATILANGCPRKQALAMQARSAVALLEAFAPLAEKHALQELRRGLRGGDVLVRKIPVGVSVGVAPWNAPVFLSAIKARRRHRRRRAVDLEAKPGDGRRDRLARRSPRGTRFARRRAQRAARRPRSRAQARRGSRRLARAVLPAALWSSAASRRPYPRVANVSFTGGTLGGLEVLLEDFDPAAVLPEFISAMLQNNGQICGAQTRLLIDRRIYERTLETLAARIPGLAGRRSSRRRDRHRPGHHCRAA